MTASGRGHSIGLTGNIASGKSHVARRLASHGALVIDADVLAHELMQPRQPAWQAVVAAFGSGVLDPDERINRARLGAIVFSDAAALARLDQAVHPHVHAELLRRVAILAPGQVAVIEAVKLVEAGTYQHLDALWLVLSSPEQQMARLMRSRGLSAEDAARRVAAQPPLEQKLALADVVLRNDGTLAALDEATDRAWQDTLDRWAVEGDGGTEGR